MKLPKLCERMSEQFNWRARKEECSISYVAEETMRAPNPSETGAGRFCSFKLHYFHLTGNGDVCNPQIAQQQK